MKRFALLLYQMTVLFVLAVTMVYAQQLQTAPTPGGGVNLTLVGLGVLALAVLAGLAFYFLYWKPRHPAAAAVIEAQATAAGTTVSADMQALVGTVQELLSHLRDTAAANAASVAPPGGDGVPGLFSYKVIGDAKTDLPAMTTAYFAKRTTAAKRPA